MMIITIITLHYRSVNCYFDKNRSL